MWKIELHLPLFDLAANDLPPLLNDVNQQVALLHELALLAGCIHLETSSERSIRSTKGLTDRQGHARSVAPQHDE